MLVNASGPKTVEDSGCVKLLPDFAWVGVSKRSISGYGFNLISQLYYCFIVCFEILFTSVIIHT